VTLRLDIFAVPPRLAVIVTGVELDTEKVSMLNVALLAPEGTVTLDGAMAVEGLPLVSKTEVPLLGAKPVSFSNPVELLQPTTVPGLSDNELNAGAVTVSTVDFIVTEPGLCTSFTERVYIAFVARRLC
jgi:hypothetical protein